MHSNEINDKLYYNNKLLNNLHCMRIYGYSITIEIEIVCSK